LDSLTLVFEAALDVPVLAPAKQDTPKSPSVVSP